MGALAPRDIVRELDRYVIGQKEAKRAVAVALRNRWRRLRVPEELRDEIAPKNIIMIGPTGVGKTEIARRLAKLAQAPFVKVEATKFTEVGYVGRDVDSMVRDLTEVAVKMAQDEERARVAVRARENAEERLLDLLVPTRRRGGEDQSQASAAAEAAEGETTREKLRRMLADGKLDERTVELDRQEAPRIGMGIFGGAGVEEMMNLKEMFQNFLPKEQKRRKMKITEALDLLAQEEAQKLIDLDAVIRKGIRRMEQGGIIFVDEIDKVAGRERGAGPDVSREGVQRDLLPLLEGSSVVTKYGVVRTDHILFIAAGAFHVSKPSDLIPEIQGRFPIRVELRPLSKEQFVQILAETENSLLRQYSELMKTEQVEVEFTKDAVEEISEIAAAVNQRSQDIGARRLHTVIEKLLEEVSFSAPDMTGQKVTITSAYVRERLSEFLKDEELGKYIL